MIENSPQLSSFPVPLERALVHRRAVFSENTAYLGSQHVINETEQGVISQRRRKLHDESLRLIDDLTNRPVDPLFEDAHLVPHTQHSALVVWTNRFIVFIICVAVGLGVSSVVKVLHQDPRQKVREKLITQIQTTNQRSDNLQDQVAELKGQIDLLTKQVGADTSSHKSSSDDIVNGSVAVHGPGIRLTLANPLVNHDGKDSSEQTRSVTDNDLQWFISQLWSTGAEAIAVNGKRIGTQTSIRLAGQTVLVGTDSVQSPYQIEAIGDKQRMTKHFVEPEQREYLKQLRGSNITLQISSAKDIRLKAAGVPDLTYAQKGK